MQENQPPTRGYWRSNNEETSNTFCGNALYRQAHLSIEKICWSAGVQVICLAPNKAYLMCRKVKAREQQGKTICKVSYKTKYTDCEKEVLYQIPLSRVQCYIERTGRCANDQTREHVALVKVITAAGHLSAHCRLCQCVPEFSSINMLARNRDKFAREVQKPLQLAQRRTIVSVQPHCATPQGSCLS